MSKHRVCIAGIVGVLAVALSAGAALAAGGAAHKSTTLVVVSPVGVPSLDREAFGTGTQQEVITNLIEPIYRFKPLGTKDKQGAVESSQTEFVPGLCVKWSWTNKGKTFNCTLGNARSQYGNEITSEDMKWSQDLAVSAKNVGALIMNLISMDAKNPVTVVDKKHFQFNFTQKNTVAAPGLTFYHFSPYDSVEAKKHVTPKDPFAREWLGSHSAGFGAYQVTSFDANKEVRMAANPNYRSPSPLIPTPGYKTVVYRAVADNGTRAQLLQSNSAQLAKSLDLGMYQALKGAKSVTTYSLPYNAEVLLLFNNQAKPFDSVLVRKAIACGIDKAAIVSKTFYDQFQVAHTIITPKLPESTPQFDECGTQNVAAAQKYLKDAGYASGLAVTLTYSRGNSGQDAQDNATLIQSQLAPLGIKVNLVEEPDATKFFVGAITHAYGMFLFDVGSNVPDIGWHMGAWFTPGSVLNFNNSADPALKGLMNIIKAFPEGSARRNAAALEFQRLQMSNQMQVPIAYIANQYVVNNSVCNLVADPGDFAYWQFLKPC